VKNSNRKQYKSFRTIACASILAFVYNPSLSAAQENLPELLASDDGASGEISDPAADINEVLQKIDEATSDNNTIEEVMPEPVSADAEPVIPEPSELKDPVAANTEAAIKQVSNIPTVEDESNNEPTVFFDADQLLPKGELARNAAPRKVNPINEPGSKLIVVKKDHRGSSRSAQLVAAERAMKLGRYQSALEIYNTLYSKNRRDPNVLMGRAEAYQRLGEDELAVEAYEKLLDIRPNNVEARVNTLGIVGQKYPEVALRQLMELREKHPDNVGVIAQIAVAQANAGSFNEAINYLGMAASIEPENASHLFNMAVIADRAGDKASAIKYYEQALETDTLYGKGKSVPRQAIFDRLASIR